MATARDKKQSAYDQRKRLARSPFREHRYETERTPGTLLRELGRGLEPRGEREGIGDPALLMPPAPSSSTSKGHKPQFARPTPVFRSPTPPAASPPAYFHLRQPSSPRGRSPWVLHVGPRPPSYPPYCWAAASLPALIPHHSVSLLPTSRGLHPRPAPCGELHPIPAQPSLSKAWLEPSGRLCYCPSAPGAASDPAPPWQGRGASFGPCPHVGARRCPPPRAQVFASSFPPSALFSLE
mmetsp:Transcript_15519/g.42107  ORF Transcript_15519/g.42107 Transcript_15519/m.42107 type:complete len:238 (-) Transcript_15519:730-1443(-)